ncbi:ATP-binding cassette domain-containing protein [Hymenobacter sp. HD11105]
MAESSSGLTPVQRLWRLLLSERRDITYLYVYAALAGFITLSLPLGVQSVIGFVSSGAVSTSLVVLIIFIVLGTVLVGGLQIMQVYLVEFLQQRLFARVAFGMAVRVPRVRTEALGDEYLPELMNRMLDTPTLQKGLAILLIDFSTAGLQILFGLLLLSFYHPAFIAFGLLLIIILSVLLRLTWRQGLETSLTESKYKYRVVSWLEDVARTVHTFRLAPRHALVLDRTDEHVNGYIKARRAHFRVLIVQYFGFVGFKTLITGGLLILGCYLLVNEQINIGQFVASEIVIILTIGAVEKILIKLDVLYDALTSIHKIGHVLDLPLIAEAGGANLSLSSENNQGLAVDLRSLSYHYPSNSRLVVDNVSLQLQPNEHLGLAGYDGSGRTTLLRIMGNLLDGYQGILTYDNTSLRDLSPETISRTLGENFSHQHLFSGTVLENLTLNQPDIKPADVSWALDLVGLRDEIYAWAQGLGTYITAGSPMPDNVKQKLLLARALVRRPRLLLLDHFLPAAEPADQQRILKRILAPEMPWTLVVASCDPRILTLCTRTAVLREGRIVADGTYEEIAQTPELHDLLTV